MLVIGITGGIGSGKTAATNLFEKLGINVVDADIAAREVVEKGSIALQKIAERFGQDILLDDQSLNRAKLRSIIFNDPNEKKWLEQLTHPLIRENIIANLQAANSPYVILSSPLLVESGQSSLSNKIVVVDVPEDTQLKRASQRDNNSIEQIKAIMAAQISRSERLTYADHIIDNNQDLTFLEQQVQTLHEYFLQLSSKHES